MHQNLPDILSDCVLSFFFGTSCERNTTQQTHIVNLHKSELNTI